ncbi:flagellar motor switch protein FliG [Thermodesulforhabdus norvegica]|uniref:Flagellar motor switch protein FliG n=1 Tax=Thermodesulforhabdus norvegica TaxID=39841 RepID=A0A1I4R788_9BACT|nr:flagellar motor switch protein FliG [Thermodesulforhabdus norvegica]SFM47773.1 flagellar motor switch protein FliG [Thermodesulforhabdus norvegica]
MAEKKKDKQLSGVQKAALVLLSLGEQVASQVLKHLKTEEIKKLGLEMSNLRHIDRKVTEEVLKEFNAQFQDEEALLVTGDEYLKRLLPSAIGSDKASEVFKSIEKEKEKVPFKNLRDMDARVLANFLKTEHPQTVALVIVHLGEEKASQVLSYLPEPLQFEVITRITSLDTIPSDVIKEVDEALEQELLSMGELHQVLGGVQRAAEILNRCDRRTADRVLQALEEADAELAEKVRKLMFVFEDLVAVPDQGIRELLKEVDNKDLVIALKTASEDLKQKIFKNLSKRAAQMLEEDLAVLGPVRLSEVEEAQQRILEVTRRLEREGRIVLVSGEGGDAFV